MKIKFDTLQIENFMSLGQACIDLKDRGYTLVSGVNNFVEDLARSNGSGKSSIFEAIVWCLTGETMRGNKDIVNINAFDGSVVTLKFFIDEKLYEITRSKEHSVLKTTLKIKINGEDKSGKGIRDTEKLLKEYLPDLTTSLIGSVIILGQGMPTRFTNNSPSGRKEVLEKLCKSDFMIEDLKQRISLRRNELNEEIRQVQDNRLVNLTKIETLTNRINLDEVRYNQLEEMYNLESEADILHKELLELRENSIKLNDKIECYVIKRNETIDNISQCKIEKAELIQKIDDEYESTIQFANEGINTSRVALELAKSELNRVLNIKDICPTCGQKIPDVHKPDTITYRLKVEDATKEYHHWTGQLSKIKKEIEQKKLSATDNLCNNIVLFENQSIELLDEINSLKTQYSSNEKILTDKTKLFDDNMILQKNRLFEMKSLRESIENNQVIIDNLVLDNKELDKRESVLNERLSIESKFNTAVTRDFRGFLLKSVIDFIDDKAKEYAKDIFETDLISFSLQGNNISICYNNKEYEALSGGERQKVDLIIQFSIRDMLCTYTGFSTNILALDEIFDNLDDLGSQKVIDLISTKLSDISTVFIVSHHGNELNIPCDNEILVIKDSNGVSSIR